MPLPRYAISRSALKTAWKMVDTIFPQYNITRGDQDRLLTLLTIASLFDLLGWVVEWRKAPKSVRLVFSGREIGILPEAGRLAIRAKWHDDEVDSAIEAAETLMARYDLPEEERATLYTALPCLGAHALKSRLLWNKKPPFPEVN